MKRLRFASLLALTVTTLVSGAAVASAGEVVWWTPNWGEARARELEESARALTNLPAKRLTGIGAGRHAVNVIDGISVAAPPEQVWPLISDYSIFRFLMPDVRDIRRDADARTSHWEIAGPAGVPVRFQAEETSRVEGHEITWKTTEGQLIAHTGNIRVDPEPDVGSRIQVELSYNPVAGAIGHAFAKLFGADPRHKLDGDLRRLKTYIESGKQPADVNR